MTSKENGEEFYKHSDVFNITEKVTAASDRVLNLGANCCLNVKDMEILKGLGLDKVRSVITWDTIETQTTGKGNYDFSKSDEYMARAEEYGLKITAVLAYGNTLYGTQNDKSALTGEAKTAFVNFAKAAARRYPDVSSFEIWNEPNSETFWNGNVADYITLAKETVAAIREINNDVKIYVGSIDVSKDDALDFADSLLKEQMDINGISYHPYFHEGISQHYGTAEGHLAPKIGSYSQTVLANGGWMKLPVTEIGYETHVGGVQKASWPWAARETVKALITLQSANENDIDIYCLRDTSRDNNSFGMLSKDYDSSDVLYGVNQYAAELGNAIYVAPINTGDADLFGHLYIRNDKTPIVVMYAAAGTSEKTYSFGGNVTYEDFYGNNEKTATTVTVGENPVYIKGLTMDNVKEIIKADLASKYSEYSTEVVPAYQNVENNAASIKNLLDEHYKNGFELINGITDEKEKFASLYKWNNIGEIIAKYYALFATDEYIGAKSRAKAYISGEKNYYANAIARYALDYANIAEKFNQNSNASFAAAYEALAQTLISYANYFDGNTTDAVVKQTDSGLQIKLFANADNVSANYYLGMYDAGGVLVKSMNIPFSNKSALDSTVSSLTLDKTQYSKIKLFSFGENIKPLNDVLEIK